ncbi:PEP-CTERM sorting domain-containing protein [uncultured Aquabacterium sp.]|jgi:hypothetical protein|uniref:PEP-CTERM sorting domain-containing protein n=1 Tax=uncultured Aquabacterium sp. TaxID=158753 RepID=UPI00260A1798|nr:PEP-CTERM sorting domain-containing protein [uncultured Aquabacterium sp.]
MHSLIRSSLVAAALIAATAHAETIGFTNTTVGGVALTAATGAAGSTNLCSGSGVCATSISYNTAAGGLLTVTAKDSPDFDTLALVHQSKLSNAGLGVVTGYMKSSGFDIVDGNYSLSQPKETLTLSFQHTVALSQLVFFPDDRLSLSLTRELDDFDGFTVSVDGRAAVEYSFGKNGGQPVTLSTPLIGNTFTFGYAVKKSPEDYYLAGLKVTAVPEASTLAMMGLGLAGVAAVARRRRA